LNRSWTVIKGVEIVAGYEYKIPYGKIEDAGIQVNCVMGISDAEKAEVRKTELLTIIITTSGQVGLFYSDNMPALNGVSAGGYLRRDDDRSGKIKRLLE